MPRPRCGDGRVDPGEVCDDGNTVSGDGCRADCKKIERCGDGILDTGEVCDDGNTASGDGCRADCEKIEVCGDGVLDAGEVCDDGNRVADDGCRADCKGIEVCGDGLIDEGEVCLQAAPAYPVHDLPVAMAMGDLDGDGELDVVTANSASFDDVSVVFGTSRGGFTNAEHLVVGDNPEDVVLVDVDRDGDLDIIAVLPAANTIAVLLNDGHGHFASGPVTLVGNRPHQLVAGDLNGDGLADLVVLDTFSASQTGSDAIVLLGQGDGTFTRTDSHIVQGPPATLRLADITDDGVLDIITSDGLRGVGVLAGHGDGTFDEPVATVTGGAAYGVEIGDFDEDGRLDVAVGGPSVTVLAGQADGGLAVRAVTPFQFDGWKLLTSGDIDGDGHLDVVVAQHITDLESHSLGVLFGRGDGSFDPVMLTTGFEPSDARIVDVDHDGAPDLVVSNQLGDHVRVLLSQGDHSFVTSQSQYVGDSSYGIVLTDLNRDGLLDMVTSDGTGGHAVVALGDGTGAFLPSRSFPVAPPGQFIFGPIRVVAVDLNRDGIPDLVTANTHWGDPGEHTVSVLMGVGDGTFSAPVLHGAGLDVIAIATGDFDVDGHVDVVTADLNSGTVSLLRGNSTGDLAPAVSFPAGGAPLAVVAADVTGDGRLDLVVGNAVNGLISRNGNLTLLQGLPGGKFAAPVTLLSGVRIDAVAVDDLDHDGRPDIVAALWPIDEVAILRGKPGGGFAAPALYGVFDQFSQPFSIVLADINGDGQRDIVTGNLYRQSVTVLIGAGDATFPHQRTFGADGEVAAVAAGDLNGDGRIDIVARTTFKPVTVMLGLPY